MRYVLTILLSIMLVEQCWALSAPGLILTTQGINVTASWTSSPNASGYRLYYAPYPFTGEVSIGNIDMGMQTRFSVNLWDNAAFYIAVRSYDSSGLSEYSNVELFILDQQTNNARLPDSGQFNCSDFRGTVINCASTGQDGEYANNTMSFTDLGNGTIKDNVTGLIWQKADDGIGRENDEANMYCSNLILGGISDWRLPNIFELTNILDYGRDHPALNPVFTRSGTFVSMYWSSTPAGLPGFFYQVDFHDGFVNYFNYRNNYVRCVR